MKYLISNKDIKLTVNSKGAEPVSLIFNGTEKLWQNDNGKWGRSAPILFPHAGKCSVIVDGKRYKDLFHGFARDYDHSLLCQTDDSLLFSFKSNEITKEYFPYDFELQLGYRLEGNKLVLTQRIINPTNEPIYTFIGCHESYVFKKEIGNYYIEFQKEEDLLSNIPTDKIKNSLINATNILDMDTTDLDNGQTIILDGINSRSVTIKEKGSNKEVVNITFDGYPNLLLWHVDGSSHMLCVEPWMNLPDNEIDDVTEFKNKKSILKIDPNSEILFTRYIEYLE